MCTFMMNEILLSKKSFSTVNTSKVSFTISMHLFVCFKCVLRCKIFTTNLTAIWPHTCMCIIVLFQRIARSEKWLIVKKLCWKQIGTYNELYLRKLPTTGFTCMVFGLRHMHFFMYPEHTYIGKYSTANVTNIITILTICMMF